MTAGIKDVAALANVSTATVSRALSGRAPVSREVRERVLRASAQLKFVPSANAAGLASGRSRNIGVVVPSVDRWFCAKVLHGISGELLDRGYDLSLYTAESDDHRRMVFEHHLLRQRLDAVVAVALDLTEPERDQLLSVGRPVVGVGRAVPGVTTVGIDEGAGAELATGHLVGLGHRAIAHLTGRADPARGLPFPSSPSREFERAMAAAGLEVHARWVVECDSTLDDAYASAQGLLRGRERPTAVFAASDEMAVGVVLAARDLGLRVPDDVSVVGVDGHELGELLGLTTVRQFPERQGARAAALLMAQLGFGEPAGEPHHETVTTDLVVRQSTAAPLR